ncbi:MAG: PhnA domain-containing protein [Rugosibacter sp.]|nr:PhnA domain-containing protein [Rugosibacter sp.]
MSVSKDMKIKGSSSAVKTGTKIKNMSGTVSSARSMVWRDAASIKVREESIVFSQTC